MSDYNPSANLSIDFNCQYNPPSGLVSVNFPDIRCPDLGDIVFSEGSCSIVVELSSSNSIDAQAGETTSFELNTYKLLGEVSGYEGQNFVIANLVTSAFFSAQVNEGSTLNQVLLSIFPSALLEPRSFAGENSYVDSLIKSTFFAINQQDGEECDFDLRTYPSINVGVVSLVSGEILQPSIYKWTMLLHDYVSGEFSNADIETNPPDLIVANNYAGENIDVSVLRFPQFEYNQFNGEIFSTNLSVFPSIDLTTVNARSGELLSSFSLYTYRLFAHTYLGGELAYFDIVYVVNEGSPSNNYSGECAEVTLVTQDALPSIAYGGEGGSVDVSTTYALDFSNYNGEVNTFNLQLRAPINFSFLGYSGELLVPPYINYTTRFSVVGYNGEFNSLTFTTYPGPEFLFSGYSGEYGNLVYIQIPQALESISIYEGARGEISYLDFIENYRFIAGENVTIPVSTEDIFNVKNYYFGENASLVLTTRPSEGIGRLQPVAGEALDVDALKTIQHHNLYVVFWHDTHVQVDIGSQTYFDLVVDSCCGGPRPLKAQVFRVEMDFAEYPDQVHYGDRIVFQVDLHCRHRFRFDAYSGEFMDIIDKTDYIAEDDYKNPQMYFRNGESFSIDSFECNNIHRLCKGFFIPNGNNIEIELIDVLDENCYVDRIYTGERFNTVLSATSGPASTNYFGESASASLTLEYWLAYGGECAYAALSTTVRQDGWAREGSSMFIKFYEPDWVGFGGESAFVTSLEIDIQVEFLEEGCLDNEYIYMNEDGDPIPEKFESVPIELYPYQHNIKARCF